MAWILRCILWITLFQISTHAAEIAEGRALRHGERAANQKSNGSYKILNKLPKPFVNKRAEDRFVFPGEEYKKSRDYTKPIIPEECRKIGICDDIPNYPEELVADLIQQLERTNKTRFNKDIMENENPKIAQRIGDDEDIDLCESEKTLYTPRAAQDHNNEWRVILNDKKNPQQQFRVEICKGKDLACSPIAYFQNGYTSKCIQKFMSRPMVAINGKNEVAEMQFDVPTCCTCVATRA